MIIAEANVMTPEQVQELEELAKAARRNYDREYRAANKDKVRQWNHNYWIRRGKELRERKEANGATE